MNISVSGKPDVEGWEGTIYDFVDQVEKEWVADGWKLHSFPVITLHTGGRQYMYSATKGELEDSFIITELIDDEWEL